VSIVETEDRGPVRHVVLNRPEKRNALNDELIEGLREALTAAAADDGVKCVVVRGAGPMFSSGMDFAGLGALAADPSRLRAFRRPILETWNLLEEMTKPTIAQIHGACIGRAKELVMASKLIDGTEAERIGLVNRVAPAEALDAATDALVGELLACAPVAVGHAKRVLDAAAKPALAATLEQEVTVQALCAQTEDFAEGTRAFAEKRQPEFSGR
jgi:enoyl-CoA hydratase/carnithine racemase